ncbi:MAG: tripartite tricarboxylate transporter substrate binding protein [Caldimonas sp.]
MLRRTFHRLLGSLAFAASGRSFADGPATADASPGQITRILVGFPAGQATDQVARLVAERLQSNLGQYFIVENRPGQGGSIALTQLAKSPPDGSFISLSALAGYVVNPYLYRNVSYDATRDFDPIAMVADLPLALVVNPSVPANTLKELIDYAKANPEKLSNSSSGNGTLSHLLMEDLKHRAGIKMLHVPYQGSPKAIIDLIAGNVQVGLDTTTVTLPQVKAGKLKLIAAGSLTRLPDFPDTPTIAESGFPGFEAVAWVALTAPAGTPLEWRQKLNTEVDKALHAPDFAARMRVIGALPRPMSILELEETFHREQKRWQEIVERTGIRIG